MNAALESSCNINAVVARTRYDSLYGQASNNFYQVLYNEICLLELPHSAVTVLINDNGAVKME